MENIRREYCLVIIRFTLKFQERFIVYATLFTNPIQDNAPPIANIMITDAIHSSKWYTPGTQYYGYKKVSIRSASSRTGATQVETSGILETKIRPYRLTAIRLSRTVTTPRSVLLRIKRPKP